MEQPPQDKNEEPKVRRHITKSLIIIGRRTSKAFIGWLGEAVVGLLPLLTHSLLEPYSNQSHEVETRAFISEICILSVVISGLSVLSIIPYVIHPRRAPFTAWTYLLCLTTMLALIFGAMFYALVAANIDKPSDAAVPWYTLIAAIAGSLGLALERAILESIEG